MVLGRFLGRFLMLLILLLTGACSISTQRQGGVRVISNVPDAVLYVDEEIRGPVRAHERRYIYLDPGAHRLMLQHPEHFTEFIDVEIPSNRGVAVRVDMRRRPEQ